MDEERFITPEEAISLLIDKEEIHTFRNPAVGVLIGANLKKERIIHILKENPDKIEISGNTARAMKHGITVEWEGFLFIETDPDKLEAFDPADNPEA
jgi:hypothetical protein